MTFLVLLLPISAAAFTTPDQFGKGMMMNRGIVTDASALAGRGAPPPTPTKPTLDLPLPTNETAPPAPATGSPAPASAPNDAPAPNDYLKRTAEGHIEAEVLDLLYAAQDATLRKDFEGKTVQLTGQLMPETSNNPGAVRFKAVRMFMTCCAADARPVATLVEAEKLPDLPEMTWVKVTGKATFPVENGRRTAILKADSVAKTEPPPDSMLY